MKTKFIVIGTAGVLGIASMVFGATTLAANASPVQAQGEKIQKRVMFNKDKQATMLSHFATLEEAEKFRAEIQKTRDAKDYAAFKKIHETYGITDYASEEQFQAMLQRRADAQIRKAARGTQGHGRGMGMGNK